MRDNHVKVFKSGANQITIITVEKYLCTLNLFQNLKYTHILKCFIPFAKKTVYH